MENFYNDELLPENYEQIAKAYSKSLKNKGFIFIRLDEEEFSLLLGEIFVLIAKMKACLDCLKAYLDAKVLLEKLNGAEKVLLEKFEYKKPHKFKCVADKNSSFLSLISLENLLILKLMMLSVKSGEIELCQKIISSVANVFAQSFSTEGFIVENF